MPRKSAAKLTKKEKEKWFVGLYIKAGAHESSIAACEKRARLKAGSGQKILKRKAVQAEIYAKLEPVRMEQFRQQVLSESVELAKAAQQAELRKTVSSVQRMKIDLEVLDHELMSMAVGLQQDRFPKEKLDAIKAAYVVFGTLESGNTRRLIPPEHLQQNDGQGTYTSLFNRLALKPATPTPLEASPSREDGVFDLVPRSEPSTGSQGPLPPPGEAIDDAPVAKSSNVVTVEVG